MEISVGQANGRGHCKNCDKPIPKGKGQLIYRTDEGWRRLYCKTCSKKLLDKMARKILKVMSQLLLETT